MTAAEKTKPCPRCGNRLSYQRRRDIGRTIRKEEVALMYQHDPEGYAKLPAILGRKVGPWETTWNCGFCGAAHDEIVNLRSAAGRARGGR